MSQSFGTHEVHRTFRRQAAATRGYLSMVIASVTPCSVLRPRIMLRLDVGACSPLKSMSMILGMASKRLEQALGAAVDLVGNISDDGTEAMLEVLPEGKSWPELVNALCPRDPEAQQRLDELFYLPTVA